VIEQFSKTSGELCKDVYLLSEINAIPSPPHLVSDMLLPGKSAVVTTTEGLRIACIGGTYKAAVYDGSELPHVRVCSKGTLKR
jgi:hypothetical protein